MLNNFKTKIKAFLKQEIQSAVRDSFEEQSEKHQVKCVVDRVPVEQLKSVNYVRELKAALDADDPKQASVIIKRFAKLRSNQKSTELETAKKLHSMLVKKRTDERYRDSLSALFYSYYVDEFTSDQFADVYNMRFSIMQAASLKLQYVRRRRMKQIGQVPDRYLTSSKLAGEEFAQMAGVRCPKSEHGLMLSDLKRGRDGIIIKPQVGEGSKGVFLVNTENDIWNVKDHKPCSGWDEMIATLQDLLNKGVIRKDLFEVQEAIYTNRKNKEMGRDLKFYTFYGDVPAVKEIIRAPYLYAWWWSEDGKIIYQDEGIPEDVKPMGFTKEMLEEARRLSLKIPAPFMRLDFLRGEDHLYFGEFCSMSGGQIGAFMEYISDKWDRIFGNCYLKAEMRLMNDLLAGKKFDEINEFNKRIEARKEK